MMMIPDMARFTGAITRIYQHLSQKQVSYSNY